MTLEEMMNEADIIKQRMKRLQVAVETLLDEYTLDGNLQVEAQPWTEDLHAALTDMTHGGLRLGWASRHVQTAMRRRKGEILG